MFTDSLICIIKQLLNTPVTIEVIETESSNTLRSMKEVTMNYLQSIKNDEKTRTRKPGVRQQKKMLAMVISKGVMKVMSNHTFKTGTKYLFSQKGGHRLTGV